MTTSPVDEAVTRMQADGATPAAIATFTRHHRALLDGAAGLIAEADIDPLTDLDVLEQLPEGDDGALSQTVIIKLNGGLGTSMGLAGPKSLLPAKDGQTFLDIIVRQVLAAREQHGAALPLVLMNSFSTRAATEAALAGYDTLPVPGVPMYLMQSRVPKLYEDGLQPASWPADPELEWCPPGHGDLYQALWSSGVLRTLLDAGYRYAFCSNSDNLGATVDAAIPSWMSGHDVPFVIESCRRIPADRKGGHLAVRKADGRIILRETAQTSSEDQAALQDLGRHRYCSSNNIWLDLVALDARLARTDGVLELPLIRNVKTVDPIDATSPRVIQAESAMGAAIECFAGARSVLVPRTRFVPVKTTNDLLVLRSDRYVLDHAARLSATVSGEDPFVDLDPDHYKLLAGFEQRFPDGAPSLRDADRFVVRGDVTFGAGVVVRGDVTVERSEPAVVADTVLAG